MVLVSTIVTDAIDALWQYSSKVLRKELSSYNNETDSVKEEEVAQLYIRADCWGMVQNLNDDESNNLKDGRRSSSTSGSNEHILARSSSGTITAKIALVDSPSGGASSSSTGSAPVAAGGSSDVSGSTVDGGDSSISSKASSSSGDSYTSVDEAARRNSNIWHRRLDALMNKKVGFIVPGEASFRGSVDAAIRVPLRQFTDLGFDPELIQRGTIVKPEYARQLSVSQFPLFGSYAVGGIVPHGEEGKAKHSQTLRQLQKQAAEQQHQEQDSALLADRASTVFSGLSGEWGTVHVGRGEVGAGEHGVVGGAVGGGGSQVPRWLTPVSAGHKSTFDAEISRLTEIDDQDVLLWPSCLVSSHDFADSWRALPVSQLPTGLQKIFTKKNTRTRDIGIPLKSSLAIPDNMFGDRISGVPYELLYTPNGSAMAVVDVIPGHWTVAAQAVLDEKLFILDESSRLGLILVLMLSGIWQMFWGRRRERRERRVERRRREDERAAERRREEEAARVRRERATVEAGPPVDKTRTPVSGSAAPSGSAGSGSTGFSGRGSSSSPVSPVASSKNPGETRSSRTSSGTVPPTPSGGRDHADHVKINSTNSTAASGKDDSPTSDGGGPSSNSTNPPSSPDIPNNQEGSTKSSPDIPITGNNSPDIPAGGSGVVEKNGRGQQGGSETLLHDTAVDGDQEQEVQQRRPHQVEGRETSS